MRRKGLKRKCRRQPRRLAMSREQAAGLRHWSGKPDPKGCAQALIFELTKGLSKKSLLEFGADIFLRDKAPRIQAQLGYVSFLATQQRPVCVQNTHRQTEKSKPKTEWGFWLLAVPRSISCLGCPYNDAGEDPPSQGRECAGNSPASDPFPCRSAPCKRRGKTPRTPGHASA